MSEDKFETIPDVPLNEEFYNALREAGASRLFMEVVRIDPDDLPEGVNRNSAQSEVRKYCYWEDEISAEAIEDKLSYGGHFFQTLWEGNLDTALARADRNNRRILEHLGYAIPA